MYSDAVMLDALRQAASVVGEPMSTRAYESFQRHRALPAWLTIVHRFGTWSAACNAAGLHFNAQHKGRVATWDRPAARAAVERFLADEAESSESFAAYIEWARLRSDAPSGPTVKNIFGTWNQAKEAVRNNR